MYNEYHQPSPPSLRHKLKMCCFSSSVHDHEPLDVDHDKPRTPRSPYAWLKSTAHDFPEIRYRCRNLISRIGRTRRRSHSADFSYDPSSYALNFEDDARLDEFPFNFSERLAASPSPRADFSAVTAAPRMREIAAFS
ncbi:hypothetical protein I3843_07G221900 [Carya illinoinensis]|uniref:Uncharacterized protein n=1 Tax=Carya illinoinensis TaxID=32201 RepID=A0A8T1PZD0_CARIL|nr:uncharacterized protein LOC122314971 [Carya illinoinensis]KAG6649666.1 hypothetical protein CIPAW_07G226900 [Carya illinoinensis]KAG7973327.1 hypothetical protein I3843_07G221900 [Carya illinoinensis]